MGTGSPILQSGSFTPGHLLQAATDGVAEDSGATLANTYGVFISTVSNINFNVSNTDNTIPVNLPAGYTRYRINQVLLSGATVSLSTATCGVFTAPAAGGFAVVSSGTAITVTASTVDTNNNMQTFTINNFNTMSFSDTVLYFRVQNPQGSPAFGNVSIYYEPMP